MSKRLADAISDVEKEAGYSNEYFKISEGDNKVRLLTFPERQVLKYEPSTKKYVPVVKGDSTDGITIKWLTYVIDRGDENKVKLAKLPHSVMKLIQAFQEDEDFAFDDFPMPYDLKITAKNAGKTDVKYAVIPSPKRTEIDEPMLAELLDGKKPCASIVEAQKAKRMQEKEADAQFERGGIRETKVEDGDEPEDW